MEEKINLYNYMKNSEVELAIKGNLSRVRISGVGDVFYEKYIAIYNHTISHEVQSVRRLKLGLLKQLLFV